ncbi:MAG: hypothetical protein GVY18_15080 [Bacteroidetes bacterium]|jgi:hypothetical protein|nr:hypothetical protein [Bacteroidota bacterium]
MTVWLRIVCLASVLIVGCASTEEQAASDDDGALPMDQLQQMAAERYGAEAAVDVLPNAPESYVLVRQQRPETPEQPVALTSYFVYAVAGDTVSAEERGLPGTVAWADSHHVRVRLTPGTVGVQGEAPPPYLVDVRTGQRQAEDSDGLD